MKTNKRDKGIKGKPTQDINTCNEFKSKQPILNGYRLRIIFNDKKEIFYSQLNSITIDFSKGIVRGLIPGYRIGSNIIEHKFKKIPFIFFNDLTEELTIVL